MQASLQRGLVATVRTEMAHSTAWQRFLPEGPLALLPVRDGYSNIVWSTSPLSAARLTAMEPAALCQAINQVRALLQPCLRPAADSSVALAHKQAGTSSAQPLTTSWSHKIVEV